MTAAEEKKISDHSNHMETGLKLESLLAGYSFPRVSRGMTTATFFIFGND